MRFTINIRHVSGKVDTITGNDAVVVAGDSVLLMAINWKPKKEFGTALAEELLNRLATDFSRRRCSLFEICGTVFEVVC